MAMGFQAFGKGGGGGGGGQHHGGGGGGGHHHHHHGGGGGGFGPGWGGYYGPYGGDTYVVEQPSCPRGYAWDGYRGVCVELPPGLRGLGAARIVRLGAAPAGTVFGVNYAAASVVGVSTLIGAGAGAFMWKKHRVLGGLIGAVTGMGVVFAFNAWRSAQNPPTSSTPPPVSDAPPP
jgi:hypothetical protein